MATRQGCASTFLMSFFFSTVSPATKYVVPTDYITMRIGIKKIEV